jgi:hypothetical protein
MLLFRQRFTGCLDVPDSPVLGAVAATEYIGGWPWHYNANTNRAGVWLLVTPQKPLYALPRDDRQPLLRGHAEDRPRDNPQHRGRRDVAIPVILLRSPYGRGGVHSTMARLFAERGYHAVVQFTRGTFGCEGRIDFDREAADGRSAADWIVDQPWSNGVLGTCCR